VRGGALTESTHDAVIGMTRSGVVSSCNPAAARLYDYPADQLIGSPAEMLVPPELRAGEAAVLRRVLAGEEVQPYRAGRVCRNGTVVEMYVTIAPVSDATGAVVGATSVARRASVQEARERFEARVEKQRADARDAADRFEVRVQQEREEMRDAAERFERRVAGERVQAREAEERFLDGIAADRAQAQRDQDLLRSQLQHSQRLEVLDQLAGGVAHDFNNLLAVILNYAAFVAEELATRPGSYPESAGRDLGQIQQAAERATALTHQLLAFARREVVRPRVLDLNQVVTGVAELLGRTLGEDIVLHTQQAEDLWPVLADPRQIEQVLANLAVNARDAMSGGGTLTMDTANITIDVDHVAAGSLVRAGRYVRLRVGDTGTGMSADVAERAFEPFFTTKSDGTGTGLGLTTVYGILAQAKASVGIESQPGIGTTVTIVVPVTDEVAAPVEPAPSARRTPKGEMVLVVEDDEALRDLTGRIFTRGGYQVLKAADGHEAVALASEYDGEIQLLVTDVVMPQMLGKEVAEKIRETRPDIEVLYMSGYAQRVLTTQGRLDSDVALIEKPFSAASILERAGQLLNRHLVEADL
jgi:PAS domain S-box-containing protein